MTKNETSTEGHFYEFMVAQSLMASRLPFQQVNLIALRILKIHFGNFGFRLSQSCNKSIIIPVNRKPVLKSSHPYRICVTIPHFKQTKIVNNNNNQVVCTSRFIQIFSFEICRKSIDIKIKYSILQLR